MLFGKFSTKMIIKSMLVGLKFYYSVREPAIHIAGLGLTPGRAYSSPPSSIKSNPWTVMCNPRALLSVGPQIKVT